MIVKFRVFIKCWKDDICFLYSGLGLGGGALGEIVTQRCLNSPYFELRETFFIWNIQSTHGCVQLTSPMYASNSHVCFKLHCMLQTPMYTSNSLVCFKLPCMHQTFAFNFARSVLLLILIAKFLLVLIYLLQHFNALNIHVLIRHYF